MRYALPLLLAGCWSSPTLTVVEPDQAMPGEELQIYGERLTDPVEVRLESSAQGAAHTLTLTTSETERLAAQIPEEIEPGIYDVVVVAGRHLLRAPGSFRVLAPLRDVPCGQLYRANTKVSNVAGEVVIDKFFRSGERETVKVKLQEIATVEVGRVPGPSGESCSVITLVRSDGERLRFADDAKVDLENRAHKLAQEIGRPISVISDPVAEAE